MNIKQVIAWILWLASIPLFGQAGPASAQVPKRAVDGTTQSPSLHDRAPTYRLQPGDVLDLGFPFTPELNQSVTVQPDGFVSLTGAGDVSASGKTIEEFRNSIKEHYAGTLRDPEISVNVKDSPRNTFIVGGQVGHPGRYELRGNLTVSEAIAISGGFTEASKHSEVWLVRSISTSSVEARKLNVKKMLKDGDYREDALLQPGDLIFVPQNSISKLKSFVLPRTAAGVTFRY